MNILLAVIIAVFGGFAGLFFSLRLKEREKTMSSVLLLIKEFAVQIRYTNTEIGDILISAAKNEEYRDLYFVRECSLLNEKGNFHLLWNEGVKKQPFITAKDRELLNMLGDSLGQTDTEGQISFLEMYEELIKNSLEQAAKDYVDKGRMYRSVGLLCGLAVGIMVL
ncbi:MAG: stage III sporulation protein AB [Ruminiclostridium sp.]|nr:stage III sporulation protein AB [Ruminiclostridium sp.]